MSDPRFARLKTDPRFRRPKLKQTKVVIDERFKSVLKQTKKKSGAKVDKYGRPTSGSKDREDLKRYYRLETHEDEEEVHGRLDLARGEVLLESSDEDDNAEPKVSEGDSDDGEFVTLGADSSRPIPDVDIEVDLDEESYADLEAQAANAYPEDEHDGNDSTMQTSRLAIVNLDWDHVRARHLYKICSSLVSPSAPAVRTSISGLAVPDHERKKGSSNGNVAGLINMVRGKVLKVCVYPSDFGKKRMAQEEKDGPPPEIFKKRDLEENEVNEKTVYEVGGEEQYDGDALRKYQLERLRYYYAIVECDTVDAAAHICKELDGTELERSANVFDISFVPEGMIFENEPRDEATDELNTDYKPVDFVTDALRHSKVKLTWDDDDPERHQVTRRALTKKEIEEDDFRAYIANSSSESELDRGTKKTKKDKKASRDKLRSLLLGGNEGEIPEGWGDEDDKGDNVDMEITFTPALSKRSGEEETTLEKYQRKIKEKRKKRKEEVKDNHQESGEKDKKFEDEFFEASEDDGDESRKKARSKSTKGKKGRMADERGSAQPRKEATADELSLLVAPDSHTDEPEHFNLKSVIKAEKRQKGKKGKTRKDREDNEAQEDFVMDVRDERFKALFEDHQFAIDPSNPHFKKTKAMTVLLEERQRRRREQREQSEEVTKKSTASREPGSKTLQTLVESVKRKSANIDPPGQGKRRKL